MPGADSSPVQAARPHVDAAVREGRLADLSPAYFALVMATGIVSIAAHFQGHELLAYGLFVFNVAAWVVLWVLYVLRALRHTRRFFADMTDHLRAPGYFTAVAGTAVLASGFVVFWHEYRIAAAMWLLAAVLWLGLTYAIFTAFTIKREKPPLEKAISGAWLLAVVATQSLAVLAAMIAPHLVPPLRIAANFTALSLWLWGGMLYIWMMSLIFYRYTFFRLAPDDFAPPYWINMGAMAISTLAGSLLIINAPDAPFLRAIVPFLKGFTILYWATGTWWIPMLIVLAVWRHAFMHVPLRYDPLYWGAVFPLGMYSACTQEMARALALPFLSIPVALFFYVSLAAWAAAFVGVCRRVVRHIGPASSHAASG